MDKIIFLSSRIMVVSKVIFFLLITAIPLFIFIKANKVLLGILFVILAHLITLFVDLFMGSSFIFIKGSSIYRFWSPVYFTKTTLSKTLKIVGKRNSFVIKDEYGFEYKIKDRWSFMFPLIPMKLEQRKEKLVSKLTSNGFKVADA